VIIFCEKYKKDSVVSKYFLKVTLIFFRSIKCVHHSRRYEIFLILISLSRATLFYCFIFVYKQTICFYIMKIVSFYSSVADLDPDLNKFLAKFLLEFCLRKYALKLYSRTKKLSNRDSYIIYEL
jgi:hypothetical protein